MIPKLIHQIWVGEPPSEEIAFLMSTWHIVNPDFEIIVWDEEMLRKEFPDMPEKVWTYEPAMISDIFRVFIVYRYGGVYVDSDFEAVKPFNHIVETYKAFIGRPAKSPSHVANGLFGAEIGSEFTERIRDSIIASDYNRYGHGPTFVSNMLRREPHLCSKFLTHIFYPYYAGQPLPRKYEDDTLACHHWNASWLNRPELHKKFKDNVREVMKRWSTS